MKNQNRSCAARGAGAGFARCQGAGGVLAAIVICGFSPSYAEDAQDPTAALKSLSLEELTSMRVETVYGASKHEQKVDEAPSSVTIITRDEIQKAGYRTLAEILDSVPGLYTRYDRDYTELGIRGFNNPGDYNSSFLLLVDGHRMNVSLTGNAAIDRGFAVDVDLIERVEVIRGPGASLYGDNAFFGVINVITRRGRETGRRGGVGRRREPGKLRRPVQLRGKLEQWSGDGRFRQLLPQRWESPAVLQGI